MDMGRSARDAKAVRLAPLTPNPLVSFVVSCLHGREALAQSLPRIEGCGLRRDEFEILLLGEFPPTAPDQAIAGHFAVIQMMAEADDAHMPTLSSAVSAARGRYIVLLEDDSYPRPGSVLRMTTHFERNPALAAAVFTVTRPDGTRQHWAYPNLIARCGTALRRRMIENLSLPPSLAEPGAACELSLRVMEAGLEIGSFDDLHVTHQDLDAPSPAIALREEVRDNLLLAARHFPQKWILPFARDWLRRQRFVASRSGCASAYYKGLLGGLARAMNPARRRVVRSATFETLVRMEQTRELLRTLREGRGVHEVVLLDYAPNILAFYVAARQCGARIAAIADPAVAGARRRYRRIPILSDEHAARLGFDAAIATSLNPAQAAERVRQFHRLDARPVYDLFDSASAPLTFGAAWESHRTAARSA